MRMQWPKLTLEIQMLATLFYIVKWWRHPFSSGDGDTGYLKAEWSQPVPFICNVYGWRRDKKGQYRQTMFPRVYIVQYTIHIEEKNFVKHFCCFLGLDAGHLLQEREGGQVPRHHPAQPLCQSLPQRRRTLQHQGKPTYIKDKLEK
jgi:hypothetical protein